MLPRTTPTQNLSIYSTDWVNIAENHSFYNEFAAGLAGPPRREAMKKTNYVLYGIYHGTFFYTIRGLRQMSETQPVEP